MIHETKPDWLYRWGRQPHPLGGTRLPSPFFLPFVSRVFSYLLNYRKVVHSPFVSM
jgi:hypothetical protein